MRLNVCKQYTGDEEADWDHIDGVTDVDRRGRALRYKQAHGRGGSYDLDAIDYFHVTTIENPEGDL